MKNTFKKYLVLLLVIGFVPNMASAASIYFETARSTVSAGDTFIVSAKIDAAGTPINSVEGDITLDSKNDNFVINDFSLSKSIFSLWPRTPSLSTDGHTISFVGGVPGGFTLDKAILFNIIVEASKEGEVKISPKNMAVFANDGQGTRVPVDIGSLTIKIESKNEAVSPTNEWSTLVASDKIKPEKFEILIGQDSSMLNNQRFAYFNAVDNQSGISYYEVSENGKPAIRSGSMYVLENQDEKITPDLTVTAYDKAGNKTISIYKKPVTTIFGFSLNFVIIVVVVIIIWFILRRIRKNRKNNVIVPNIPNVSKKI